MRLRATLLGSVTSEEGGGSGGILMAHYDRPGSTVPSWRTFGRASDATRFGPTGYPPETIATGLPRFDYDPNTPFTARGLLLEGARTNLLLNSAALSTQNVTVTAAAYTLSFYGTGTVALSGAYTGSLVGTGASSRVTLTFTPTAGTLTCTVTGTVTYAQLELGAFTSSWVPTAGGSAARTNETFTGLVANEHGVSQGSKAIRIRTTVSKPGTNELIFQIDDSTANNRLIIFNNASNEIRLSIYIASIQQFNIVLMTGTVASTVYDIAVKWAAGAIQAQVAGQAASAVQAFTLPAGLTVVRYNAGNGAPETFNHLQRELSAKTPLPLSELLTRIAA